MVISTVARRYAAAAVQLQWQEPCGGGGTRHKSVMPQSAIDPPHRGAIMDWWYLHSLGLPITVLYGCCGTVRPPGLTVLWDRHGPALLQLLQTPLTATAGYVVDVTNSPIASARLQFDNTTFTSYTDHQGAFWRPLPSGTHYLTVAADGYYAVTVSLTVTDDGTVLRDNKKMGKMMVTLIRDMRVMGMERLTFIFIVGFLSLGLMVVCVCISNARSTKQRRRGYSLQNINTATTAKVFDDPTSSSEDELALQYDAGREPAKNRTKVKKKRATLSSSWGGGGGKSKGEGKRPYYDFNSSSSDEEDLFIRPSSGDVPMESKRRYNR